MYVELYWRTYNFISLFTSLCISSPDKSSGSVPSWSSSGFRGRIGQTVRSIRSIHGRSLFISCSISSNASYIRIINMCIIIIIIIINTSLLVHMSNARVNIWNSRKKIKSSHKHKNSHKTLDELTWHTTMNSSLNLYSDSH